MEVFFALSLTLPSGGTRGCKNKTTVLQKNATMKLYFLAEPLLKMLRIKKLSWSPSFKEELKILVQGFYKFEQHETEKNCVLSSRQN